MIINKAIVDIDKKLSLRKYIRAYHTKRTTLIPFMCKWLHHVASEKELTNLQEKHITCTCGKTYCIFKGATDVLLLPFTPDSTAAAIRMDCALDVLKPISTPVHKTNKKTPKKVNIYDDLEQILSENKHD